MTEKDFASTGTQLYSSFIHKSRYARWLDEQGRRETWDETVDRYLKFFMEKFPKLSKEIKELRKPIYDLEVLPSMRCLMSAGPALERDNVAGFNCSYTIIDNPRAFDEILYILMCGTGVGFSIERQYVAKLPEVAEEMFLSDTVLVVEDSKIGWATAFRELVSLLYSGKIPKWDLSKLRPAGAKLKTFGGRSSGPEPLNDLFKFTVALFKKAVGRKLSSIECHDLVCKIAEAIVVGGVRRSALISLSNVSDDRMRLAKTGQWWIDSPHRSIANNSAAYTEKPDFEIFLNEWMSLYQSKSGERGIFSRAASEKQVSKNKRRETGFEWGTNPCCVSPDTIIMTNNGPQRIDELCGKPFVALVDGIEYEAPRGSWISGEGDVYKLVLEAGYELELTKEHRVLTQNRGWVEAQNLNKKDKVFINEHHKTTWSGNGTYEQGYLLGVFLGDGNFINPKPGSSGEVKVWNKDLGSAGIMNEALEYAKKLDHRKDWGGWGNSNEYKRMSIGKLPQEFGMDWGNKHINQKIELSSCDFQRAFLRGLFDTDGHIEGSQQKSWSIRLGQSDLMDLKAVQRMLLRLGIKSRIHRAKDAGKSLLPDGRGGKRYYSTKSSWRLIISSADIRTFSDRIGFAHLAKKEKLKNIVDTNVFYSKPFTSKFKSFDFMYRGQVWDAEVSNIHSFDANGIVAHNSEIILRPNQFCNLSTVVVREKDTLEDLLYKVIYATILGTLQSSLTNFRYLRKAWKKNTEEEALLGVSMTGIMDNHLLNNPNDPELPKRLEELKKAAIETNKLWADKLGVARSAAITCIKPEGTVSQLTNTASGIHPRFSKHYIRRVRADANDPLAEFMRIAGFPCEPDVVRQSNLVFSFPIKAPENGVLVKDVGAIEQLKLWEIYQDSWCEHKPSITVYYKNSEFLEVGSWVWNKFDKISGISFLPVSDHIYDQAPYEEISEEKYNELIGKLPNSINWGDLANFESEDNTEGTQTLSCVGGYCEVVDLTTEKTAPLGGKT